MELIILQTSLDISTKRKSYDLWEGGSFGNKLRTWNSFQEILEAGYVGTLSMRYKGNAGGGFVRYEVPIEEIPAVEEEWIKKGARQELITFNESAPDRFLTIQGEVMIRGGYGYALFYATTPAKMRDALRREGKQVYGLTAKMLLEGTMTPSSFADLGALLEQHPDSVVEFSTYSICLGDIPGRNTVIWEVRNY